MFIAKHEHMSDVDGCEGHNMRRQGSVHEPHDGPCSYAVTKQKQPPKITTPAQASYFVDQQTKEELRALGGDLAIVCPLVDGRMKDLGDGLE